MQKNLKNQSWLLIADGEPLPAAQLKELANNKCVLVLDGAYVMARDAGLKIDVLLGDFDTISPADLQQATHAAIWIESAPDQNKTDLQKGLLFLDELAAQSIDICAATGLRLQHTLYNLRMLKKFHRVNRPLRLLSRKEVIRYEEDIDFTLAGEVGAGIAVLGFPNANITSLGLQYEMKNMSLNFAEFNSVSNQLREPTINFSVKGGALFIYEVMS